MKLYINRKKFVVYGPFYFPGDRYEVVYSLFQAKKLCKKFGKGSEIQVCRLRGGSRSGSLSFWNHEDTYEFV